MSSAKTLLVLTFLLWAACSLQRDPDDARAAAARINSEMISGNFASVYRESAPTFRELGSESEFVAGLQGLQKRLGSIRKATEVAYQTNVDSTLGRTHLLLFDLEYDRGRAREGLMFVRSPGGRMELLRIDIQPVE